MKAILREQRRSSIVSAVVTILLGLVLISWPNRSVKILCTLLGVVIFLTGVVFFLGWLSRRREGLPAVFLLPGVILCALGIWLITSPASAVILAQYIFCAVLLFHGVVDLQGAVAMMKAKAKQYWVDLLLGAITLAWGLLILARPFGTFSALVVLIGVALVYDGISDLVLIWRLTRAFEAWEDGNGEGA
ncbi:MAG: HdeD family acid-resistance protein [Lawsonibacter sp.]|jgi:uncharacterized membrane protein HdeD (DUF308 family)